MDTLVTIVILRNNCQMTTTVSPQYKKDDFIHKKTIKIQLSKLTDTK